MTATRRLIGVAACVPALWLAWRTFSGMLGANPVEDLLLTTGLWAFRFLLLSLAITPVRRLTGWNGVIGFRRILGLAAFFYALLHVTLYVVLDQGLEWRFILADVAKRRFITAGMAAFLLLLPLAATSTKAAIRRLGRRWQLVHRLVYFSAAAGSLHFVWKVKVIFGEPVYYVVVLAVLLGFRLLWKAGPVGWRRRQPAQV